MIRSLQLPFEEMGEFEQIKSAVAGQGASLGISGCVDSQKIHMVFGIGEGFPNKVIVTYNALRAREIFEDCQIYDRNVMLFPAKDLIFFQADVHSNKLTMERIRVLRRLMEGIPTTIVTTFDALMAAQVDLEVMKKACIAIQKGAAIKENEIAQRLVEAGYERVYQVEEAGQFSIRGGIVDIFDLTEENPYRIELWGDEVDSLRSFDVLSQRSIEQNLSSLTIYPAAEIILTKQAIDQGLKRIRKEAEQKEKEFREKFQTEEAHRLKTQIDDLEEELTECRSLANVEGYVRYFYPDTVSFLQYFSKEGSVFFLDEPSRIEEHTDAVECEFRESMSHRAQKGYILQGQLDLLISAPKIISMMENYRMVSLASIEFKNRLFRIQDKFMVDAKSIAPYNNSFETLVKDLKRYRKNGFHILLLSGSRTRAKRLAQDLTDQDIPAFYSEDPGREIKPGEVMTGYGHIIKGFEYPLIKYVFLSESDIFGREKKKKKKKFSGHEGRKIRDFSDLKVGDYVVHESHGLGIYRGIEKVEVDHTIKDYMKIEYSGGSNLYVLATNFDTVQKYASSEGSKIPKLNKLGTQEWGKTKSKAREAAYEIARDLVELYAARQQQKGFAFDPDSIWQKEFEETFPYEETEDQIQAIEATKRDMESSRIMDRLICGDVGYGKTEIAIRAAFKAVQSSKQVVYLVPTTILAQQHYQTFVQRMKDYPVRIDLMSRFRSPAEQKKTLEDLKKGIVDIVIGTHRVLSKDVQFRNLGLLIIDEEQRFGVAHKEKIKKLKENVDVLTLTATPIPRTLHMSLVGIRDMSILEEAPNERQPIQTYVMEYNEEMVREAIVRELARKGQVYYVYNRVQTIADVAARLQSLVPEAVVGFAHGQMNEKELEKIMYEFINGELDVLVSTTIIETGLDISNVNTMIIHDADNMGLSQLYQLRGRVGRSNRAAYAFLMYKRDKLLKETAEKRLQAIREYTDLGSGFKIAMRDLEIRGAGNLLGKRQHGHMAAVGYDLYCKMVNDAVRGLKGEEVKEDFETTVDLDVDAFIPASYIVNEEQKLEIYKRIATIENMEEKINLQEELDDRFGEFPVSVENLLRISLIRKQGHDMHIRTIVSKNDQLEMVFRTDAPVSVQNIPGLIERSRGKLSFVAKGDPTFIYNYRFKKTGVVEKDGEMILNLTENMIAELAESIYDNVKND